VLLHRVTVRATTQHINGDHHAHSHRTSTRHKHKHHSYSNRRSGLASEHDTSAASKHIDTINTKHGDTVDSKHSERSHREERTRAHRGGTVVALPTSADAAVRDTSVQRDTLAAQRDSVHVTLPTYGSVTSSPTSSPVTSLTSLPLPTQQHSGTSALSTCVRARVRCVYHAIVHTLTHRVQWHCSRCSPMSRSCCWRSRLAWRRACFTHLVSVDLNVRHSDDDVLTCCCDDRARLLTRRHHQVPCSRNCAVTLVSMPRSLAG
jgi:hypothetical protein